MNLKKLIMNIFRNVILVLAVITVVTLIPAAADNPSFFLANEASCSTPVTTLESDISDTIDLYVCIDSDNEGTGFFGAEVNIDYDEAAVNVSNIQCNLFDTCLDNSAAGMVSFFGAATPLVGQPSTTQEELGRFTIDFNVAGDTSFTFSLAEVVNDAELIENRDALDLTITVTEPEEEVVEEVVEEEVVEEEVVEEVVEEAPRRGGGKKNTDEILEEVLDEPVNDLAELAETADNALEELTDEIQDTVDADGVNDSSETEEEIVSDETTLNLEGLLDSDRATLAEQEALDKEAERLRRTGVAGVEMRPATQLAAPGSLVQIISSAHYYGDRASENITSCFPCPTRFNHSDGITTYEIVAGPGSFSGSKLWVNPSAVPGDLIIYKAHFYDNVSETSGESNNRSIQVVAPISRAVRTVEEATTSIDEVIPEADVVVPEADEVIPVNEEADEDPQVSRRGGGSSGSDNQNASLEVVTGGGVHSVAAEYATEALIALDTLSPQKPSDLEIPTQPVSDVCQAEFSASTDSDQDGLSDRTECYLGTDAQRPDSDGDSCFDGEEVNRFYTNPLTPADCNITEVLEEKVLIVDPQPDWILKSLDISGLVPPRSQQVGVTALPALQGPLSSVIASLEALSLELDKAEPDENLGLAFKDLEESLVDFSQFSGRYGQEYQSLSDVSNQLLAYVAGGVTNVSNNPETAKELTTKLNSLQSTPVFLGEVTELQEIGAGQNISAGFHLVPELAVQDGVYDLVATAVLENGETLSGAPLRIVLDSTVEVASPKPHTLDGISFDAFANGFIQVGSNRPALKGESVYGTHVFATWESLVLVSSVLADTNAGDFDIQSPRELDEGENHTVSLYAVHPQAGGNKVRSETVSIDFSVGPGRNYAYWVITVLALLALSALVAKRRMIKIDHIAPEHRAMENELYEAFGLEEHHDHDQPDPKEHEAKQGELEEAFGKMDVDVKLDSDEKDKKGKKNKGKKRKKGKKKKKPE